MTLSRSNPRARGRWLFLGGLVATLMLTVVAVSLAVHDLTFQLDGNTSTAPGTVPNPANQTLDWESLFNADGSSTGVIDPDAGTGFTGGSFDRDFQSKVGRNGTCALDSTGTTFCTADTSTYATGSKDSLDITGWQCNRDNNVNSKIDIMNAYAAQYVDPITKDRIMYFGLDKNKDNGNNNVAFWFLRGDSDCVSPGGAVDFSGTHQDGDVLVVSAFTNGGGVSNIDAYRWDGVAGCIDNPTNPAVCDGKAIGSGGDCKGAGGLDSICATTNSGPNPFNTNITTSWLTADATLGVGHTVVPPDFFEGGINLTKVFASAGGVPSCFNTFIANTRSSQELTATLFDFARGTIGSCETTLTTTAAGTADGSIGTGSVSSGTDSATLTITGTTDWGGTLSFYLCGPVTADGCDQTEGVLVTELTVTDETPAADLVSGTATLTSAGRYCWSAHFEPNAATAAAGVDPADDDGENECFTVNPVTPTLTTLASCTSTPCVLGVDTISDTATLTGTASQPGSDGPSTTYPTINPTVPGDPANDSITWNLYGPGDCGTTALPLLTTSRTVSGDGTYPTAAQAAVSYTPALADGVGDYVWVASYPGDSPNTNAAPTTGCADPLETVTLIGSASSATQQRWLPNDRIVLSTTGGTTLDGTLTVTLYKGTFAGTAENCTVGTGVAVLGQQYTFDTSPLGVPSASGSVFQTSNTTFYVGTNADGTAAGTNGDYFWLVEYDDANLTDPPDRCETTDITITD